jgi:DNA (cytosine-5)-methyltransferase 1
MRMLRVLDLFSCIGCHAIGLHEAGGFETVQFVEINPVRQAVLAARFGGIPIHGDIRTYRGERGSADVIVGGPPCQRTSKASAIHGYRTGASLWPEMRRVCNDVRPEWIVVEQPHGNAEWEAEVADDLRRDGWHTARLEFEARDLGAPYERRRVFIVAHACLSRLAVAWQAGPREIERLKGAAAARAYWSPDQLLSGRVDALSAGEMVRSESRIRRERIEAIGDSNPPVMMEAVGRAILASRP